MSIEEKVGQMFFVRCPEMGAAEDVATYHLGGLLLFGRDYKDADGGWLSAEELTAKLESYQAAGTSHTAACRWPRRSFRSSSAATRRAAR